MGEVDDNVVGLVEVRLEAENDVVDEQVAVRLADLVASSNVVEDGDAGPRRSRLVENVERLDGFEFIEINMKQHAVRCASVCI